MTDETLYLGKDVMKGMMIVCAVGFLLLAIMQFSVAFGVTTETFIVIAVTSSITIIAVTLMFFYKTRSDKDDDDDDMEYYKGLSE